MIPATVGIVAIAGVAGGSLMNALSASAATPNGSAVSGQQTDPQDSTASPGQADPAEGRHVSANGVKETTLTGDVATKAQAAALAAVPGGTVLRIENDAEGATYEAHVKKADGSRVTVKMDANFNVTGTETGPGFPPHTNVNSN